MMYQRSMGGVVERDMIECQETREEGKRREGGREGEKEVKMKMKRRKEEEGEEGGQGREGRGERN